MATNIPEATSTNTAFLSTPKPDVSQLFQKLGDKLGWFQYHDINTAIQTLSKSAKKKSSKSHKPEKSKISSKPKIAEIHVEPAKLEYSETKNRKRPKKDMSDDRTKSSKSEDKENKVPPNRPVRSLLYQPLRDTLENSTEEVLSCQDRATESVPVRPSSACTDLTKPFDQVKTLKKIKIGKATKISSDLNSPEVTEIMRIESDDRLSSSSARSSSSESLEDCGDYVRESTRIHSDASLDYAMDSVGVSAISFNRSEDLSGTDSWLHSSYDDSYKQLDIRRRSQTDKINIRNNPPTETDVCLHFRTLSLEDSEAHHGKGGKVERPEHYVTSAHSHLNSVKDTKADDSHVSEEQKNDDCSGSSYEVIDVSIQVETNSKAIEDSSKGSCKPVLVLSSNSIKPESMCDSESSYEVEDISVQMSPVENYSHVSNNFFPYLMPNERKHTRSSTTSDNSRNCDDISYVDVEDAAIQTSFMTGDSDFAEVNGSPVENNNVFKLENDQGEKFIRQEGQRVKVQLTV